MYSPNKNKIIGKLRSGYTPVEITPNKALSSTFKNIFKPLIKRKDLDFFFELYNMDDINLKAWSFLGIYHILEDKQDIKDKNKDKLYSLVLDLLNEKREVTYYGGSVETRAALREHHITRLVELDNSLIFEPVLEYCNSFKGSPDGVIMELLEHVLSHSSEKYIEDMILHFSESIGSNEIGKKISIVNSFGNLCKKIALQRKVEITDLFKEYLKYPKDKEKSNFLKNRKLEELIFKVGALLELDLEEETLAFVDSLKYPYDSLDIIALRYKSNQKFQSILLKKLHESENPHFIMELLKGILILKDEIPKWEDLVIDNVTKYQLSDGDLITAMQNSGLINEGMMLSFLNKANEWTLKFLREYLIQYPERLNDWRDLNNSLIKILQSYKTPKKDSSETTRDYKIIKFILSIIIDLELKSFLEYSLETFKRLEDEKLKKIAIFPILKFGEQSLLLDLKNYMKKNHEVGKFVMQFLNSLERNEWSFYY
jgi:hypothetical protein